MQRASWLLNFAGISNGYVQNKTKKNKTHVICVIIAPLAGCNCLYDLTNLMMVKSCRLFSVKGVPVGIVPVGILRMWLVLGMFRNRQDQALKTQGHESLKNEILSIDGFKSYAQVWIVLVSQHPIRSHVISSLLANPRLTPHRNFPIFMTLPPQNPPITHPLIGPYFLVGQVRVALEVWAKPRGFPWLNPSPPPTKPRSEARSTCAAAAMAPKVSVSWHFGGRILEICWTLRCIPYTKTRKRRVL